MKILTGTIRHHADLVGLKPQPLFNKSVAQQRIPKLFTIHYSLFTQDEDFQ